MIDLMKAFFTCFQMRKIHVKYSVDNLQLSFENMTRKKIKPNFMNDITLMYIETSRVEH
jgi:hypothetical protein